MNDTFYIVMFILFIKLNTSIEDFISTINNPNIKYDFGHWVIYEMNIGSFTQEGTFNAAKEKLPNLKDLGIDIIWLMPIYVRDGGGAADKINSPYASIDLENTNPYYGTIDEFKNFVIKAHQLNMQVWLDWVAAHTSNYHPWLTSHREYYMENLHPFYNDASQLNYSNPDVPRIMNGILKKWIDTADIDGFRVDFISCPNVTNEYWIIYTRRNFQCCKRKAS